MMPTYGWLGGKRRPQAWWVITVIWALSVCLGLAMWLYLSREQPFDAAVWNDSAQVESGVRLGMADHLIKHGTLHGKTRDQVVAMLGEPPPTEYFRDWDLVYWLGPERGLFSIDSEWLIVRFDADGRVAGYRLSRD